MGRTRRVALGVARTDARGTGLGSARLSVSAAERAPHAHAMDGDASGRAVHAGAPASIQHTIQPSFETMKIMFIARLRLL